MKKLIYILIFPFLFSSCSLMDDYTRGKQYAGFYEEKPVVMLIMPPINNTPNVEAKEALHTTITTPLVEAGYYVVSPNLSLDFLRSESAYDAELFIDGNLELFGSVFGADAAVFTIIDRWAKGGFGISTKIRYVIKSTKTNKVLFDRSCELYLDLRQESEGESSFLTALIDVATTVVNTAMTDQIVAARKCNYFILEDLPRVKYSPDYLQDAGRYVSEKDIVKVIRK